MTGNIIEFTNASTSATEMLQMETIVFGFAQGASNTTLTISDGSPLKQLTVVGVPSAIATATNDILFIGTVNGVARLFNVLRLKKVTANAAGKALIHYLNVSDKEETFPLNETYAAIKALIEGAISGSDTNITTGSVSAATGDRTIDFDGNALTLDNVTDLSLNATGDYILGDGAGANLPGADSDATGTLLSVVTADGTVKEVSKAATQTLSGAGAPVNGTTVAWYAGQLYYDTTNGVLYRATAKSTDPDSAGTGSTWALVNTKPVEETVAISSGNAGSNLEVTGSATGTTAAFASNEYTITIPSGQLLHSADLLIVAADVQSSADGGGVADWVLVTFENLPQNTDLTNPKLPSVQKVALPNAGSLSVSNAASVDEDNAPALAWVAQGSTNATLRIGGVSPAAQGYLLKFNF